MRHVKADEKKTLVDNGIDVGDYIAFCSTMAVNGIAVQYVDGMFRLMRLGGDSRRFGAAFIADYIQNPAQAVEDMQGDER